MKDQEAISNGDKNPAVDFFSIWSKTNINIFNNAIESHEKWKSQLIVHVKEGMKGEIDEVSSSHVCELGQWIDGEGSRFAYLPSFQMLREAHEGFHGTAAEIMTYSNAGDKPKATALLKEGGKYAQSSIELIKALLACSKELADFVVKGIRIRYKISDILRAKLKQDIVSIDGGATIFDAIKLMLEHNVGSVAVYKDNAFIGVCTERGCLESMVYKGIDTLQVPVVNALDTETICVHPDDSVEQCMVLMSSTRKRHLPVEHDGKLIGIVSIGDIITKLAQYG